MERPVVLFDGVCNLCNAIVNFIIDRDPSGELRLASLQSEQGKKLLQRVGLPLDSPDTFILIEGGRAYSKSTAALRTCRKLRYPWPLLWALMAIPRPLRDLAYGAVARNRYRWFGQSDVCRMPTEKDKERFL